MSLERLRWFDEQIRLKHYPNATGLARCFAVSERTAKRDIQKLKDSMGAPLQYHPSRRGFYYSDDSFNLPWTRIAQQELLTVLILRQLHSGPVASPLRHELAGLSQKLLHNLQHQCGIDLDHLANSFSSAGSLAIPVDEERFHQLVEGLLTRRKLYLYYQSPGQSEARPRTVHPYHLQHYNGAWYLLAWCEQREDWRTFQLSRIHSLHVCGEGFDYRDVGQWRHRIQGACGIFRGERHQQVTLRFSAARAPYVREQHWCDGQQQQSLDDGRLLLRFPVADYREILMKILQHGAEVEVLEPADLRQRVRDELSAMTALYQTSAEKK
ncbi:MAG: WYL domain-containing transcriptional regulator [Desulfuromonadaceae bacterium]|nr:WYL domain-containing transcriptional regulator [Desulfuromonadaceae bacterium]